MVNAWKNKGLIPRCVYRPETQNIYHKRGRQHYKTIGLKIIIMEMYILAANNGIMTSIMTVPANNF
jgi:hypothetical protein